MTDAVTGDPVRPNWPDAARGFEITDPRRVESLYTLVLREVLSRGDLHHLNWGVLVGVWPDLRIPDRVCALWEVAFPELTWDPGLWGGGRETQLKEGNGNNAFRTKTVTAPRTRMTTMERTRKSRNVAQ